MISRECLRLQGRVALTLQAHGPAHPSPSTAPALSPAPRAARPIVLEPLVGETPRVIAARVKDTVVVFAMDDSGSMYAPWGDPSGVRYAAAQSLLGLMRSSGGGRAGVIHWGTDAPEALVTPASDVKRERRRLKRALTIPPTLGGNDLPLALRRAAEGAASVKEDETYLVFVITDGIEYVTPATHAAVAALPEGSVHMLLVDRSGQCSDALEQDWRSVAFGSFTRLNTFDTSQMAHEIAEVFAAAIDLRVGEREEAG